MARNFNGTTAQIGLSNPTLGAIQFGTFAAVVKAAADGTVLSIMCFRDTSVNRNLFQRDATTNLLSIRCGAGQIPASTLTLTVADGWCLVAARKATGTATPVLSKYVFSTGAWTHENGTSAAADVTTAAIALINAGWIASRNSDQKWSGDIAGLATWQITFTDQQLGSLTAGWDRWLDLPPNGFWILDQAATTQNVRDLSGRGVDQVSITATTVSASSAPIGYGAAVPLYVETHQPAPTNITVSPDAARGAGLAPLGDIGLRPRVNILVTLA